LKCCALIPIHDHGAAIGGVVEALPPAAIPCLIVDDGSGPATREALERLAAAHAFVEVLRSPRNEGKGAALKRGYRAARERGCTHVVQLDADGQHDARDVPRFVAAMRARPDALVLGVPVFDASAPWIRIAARQLSRGLVWLACGSRVIADPLCGFRGVPLAPALAVVDGVRTGDWMDFEPELAVRLVWAGVPVESLPTRVVYRAGNLSHFSVTRDYPRLAWLYTRLLAEAARR
jgi:glycosyltransferase involved in cell wall biosynthesis